MNLLIKKIEKGIEKEIQSNPDKVIAYGFCIVVLLLAIGALGFS